MWLSEIADTRSAFCRTDPAMRSQDKGDPWVVHALPGGYLRERMAKPGHMRVQNISNFQGGWRPAPLICPH